MLAAMAAGQAGAFARQLPLRAAMGTFIQNTLQTVRPETVGDLNAVFPLPAELVEGKGFVQPVGQLLDGFLLQILPAVQQAHLRRNGNALAHLQFIVQRVAAEGAESLDHHHRHVQLFQQHAHFPGQRRAGAVEGIAGFRVHENAAFQVFQAVDHILHQRQVGDEFPGGYATDGAHRPCHQSAHAHKAVGCTDNIVGSGVQNGACDLQIQKAGMVHENQARLVLTDLLHSLAGVMEVGSGQSQNGQPPHEGAPENAGPDGVQMGILGQRHDFFVVQFLHGGFHRASSRLCSP